MEPRIQSGERRRGYTLIELMIVMAIISILVSITAGCVVALVST